MLQKQHNENNFHENQYLIEDRLKQDLPKAKLAFILGVASCLCFSIYPTLKMIFSLKIAAIMLFVAGIAIATVALSLSNKNRKQYKLNCNQYNQHSYKLMKFGRVFSILGLVLHIFFALLYLLN